MRHTLWFSLLLTATPAMAEPPRVVTDFAPVHSLVAQVLGDISTPKLLLPQGADPHAFQMRPSQAQALSDAELVFWVGPELTPWLERALKSVSNATSVPLLDTPGTILRESSHEHGHHDDGTEQDEHAHDAHDEDHNHDPHAWLSPENGAIWLGAIAENLAATDPENAAAYRANAEQARLNLTRTDAEINAQFAPLRDKGIIVFHDAYGYMMDHYELTQLGAVRESDSAPPSAARLSEINELLSGGQVSCAFAEVAEGEQMMIDLIDGTDVKFGLLDPAGSQLIPGADLYENLLRANAGSIQDCLLSTDN